MTGYIVALLICVALSGFFSASEMSLSSANRLRLENAAEDGSRSARTALELLDRFEDALSAILIGNNLVNVASSSLCSVIALGLAASTGAAEGACATLATVIDTVIIIVCGETIPKILAKKNANRLAPAVAGPVKGLSIVLKPLIWCVTSLINLITGHLPTDDEENDQEAAVEELQSIIETAEDEDVLDEERSELLQAALDFGDISASQVMTSRVDMLAINIDDSWEDILRLAADAPYSRLPVYEGDTDNIIGILHLNALYRAMLDGEAHDLRPLLSQPCWIYKTVKLPAVLEQLRSRQTHLAIVTDEYGGTAGVITMEDVLESLVGDIWDETDEFAPEVVQTGDGLWELDGDLPIGDFLELTELDEKSFDFESETVGGWVMEMVGGFPAPGCRVTYKNLTVTVLEADGKRVEKLRVEQE
ncbi:MAG: hemolysin family protein [Oscillospiraceae bacterium]|nr:hemolysin family protein [Oscillospiraceae bacterium]